MTNGRLTKKDLSPQLEQEITNTAAQAQNLGTKTEELATQLAHVANKTRTVYSVFDFGAVGDGVTDDTEAFQTAINTIPHYSILMVGNHRLDGFLTIDHKLITLRGFSSTSGTDTGESPTSKLWFYGTHDTYITANFGSGQSLTLENVTIKGTDKGVGLNLIGGSLIMRRSVISNFVTCVKQSEGYYSKLTNSFVGYCTTAFDFYYCFNIHMSGMTLQGSGTVVKLRGQSYLVMHGGSIERFALDGIDIEEGSTAILFGTYFEGISPDSSYLASGVRMRNNSTLLATGCQIFLNTSFNFVNATNASSINLNSSTNLIVMVSGTDTRANTAYLLTPNNTSDVNIDGDKVSSILGTGLGANCKYTNIATIDGGVGEYFISSPIGMSHKNVIDNRPSYQKPMKTAPSYVEDGMLVTCFNQGFGTDDFVGINSKYGFGSYKAVRNKGQWEKVGVRLPNQVDSVATDIATLKADFNALLAKLRANGVML